MPLIRRFPLKSPMPPSISCENITKDGLANLGNTCWFNSLLQTVFRSSGPFKNALLLRAQSSADPYSLRAMKLINILEQDNRSLNHQNNLREFIADFKNDKFKTSHFAKQEDAAEALSALMDYLNLDPLLERVIPKNRIDIFEISYQSIAIEPLSYNIVLPNLNASSVQAALDHYLNHPEHILDANGNGLNINNQSYPFTKTFYLSSEKAHFQELILTLPRFIQDDYGNRKKNQNRIEIDEIITFNLYNDDLIPQKKVTMRLKSVSVHTGELGCGHYTAYVRNSDDSFDYFNDSTKSRHSPEQTKDLMQRGGYFAVYEVVEIQDLSALIQENEAEEFFDAVEVQPDEFFDAVEPLPDNEDLKRPSLKVPVTTVSTLNSLSVHPTASQTIKKTSWIWLKLSALFNFKSSPSQPSKPRFWSNWFKTKRSNSLVPLKSQTIAIKTNSIWSKILAWLTAWRSKSE